MVEADCRSYEFYSEEHSLFPNYFEVYADFDVDYDICGLRLADLREERPVVAGTEDQETMVAGIE